MGPGARAAWRHPFFARLRLAARFTSCVARRQDGLAPPTLRTAARCCALHVLCGPAPGRPGATHSSHRCAVLRASLAEQRESGSLPIWRLTFLAATPLRVAGELRM